MSNLDILNEKLYGNTGLKLVNIGIHPGDELSSIKKRKTRK